jgi:hypothetical protein
MATPRLTWQRLLYAAAVAGVIGAVTSLIAGGGVAAEIELTWIAVTALMIPVSSRAVMHLLWWGALVLLVGSSLAMWGHGLGAKHALPPFALDGPAVAGPYVATLAVAALGSMAVWLANLSGRRTSDPALPPARIV